MISLASVCSVAELNCGSLEADTKGSVKAVSVCIPALVTQLSVFVLFTRLLYVPLWLTVQSDPRAHKLAPFWMRLNWNTCSSSAPDVRQLLMHVQFMGTDWSSSEVTQ